MTAMILHSASHPAANDIVSLGPTFDAVCADHGDRIAVSAGSERITYSDINQLSRQVAATLAAAQGSIVAIYLERSIPMVAAMIGVIQAGATYLPLDTTYPSARLQETLADARPSTIITSRELAPSFTSSGIPLVLMEDLPAATSPQPPVSAEANAYVIYTSGSTGQPKGVLVTHRNILRLFSATRSLFHFNHHDVWTMFHSFAFDFSVWEMWGPLLSGGRLVIVPFALSRSPQEFFTFLADEQVTVLNQTPSAFLLLNQAEPDVNPRPLSLRTVILGGEALNLQTLKPWFTRHGDESPRIVNMYGITETTVHVTYRRITAKDVAVEKESLIGEPIEDLRIHLLDERLNPVSDGQTGEICISGAGVASGYLNRPELTAERFLQHPLAPGSSRLYRSGDLARRRPDGELVYLGRADRQVKVNGFRIELGEIEAALADCPGVLQACVVVRTDAHAGTRLASYYVGTAEAPALSRELTERLPAQMRPAFYKKLHVMPLNANGKIDRNALPSPLEPKPASTAPVELGVESSVAAIWADLLGHTNMGRDENFFDIGGTSLLLIAARTALQDHLQRAIPITWMFECTTIASLAEKLTLGEEHPPNLEQARSRAQRQRESFARARSLRSVSQ